MNLRLIHTSDWHLGQTLHQFDRSYEHQCFLDWLQGMLVREEADALLISGDVFDNANPSAASQKQFYRFLQQAKAAVPHLNIVITAGNHDSPGRLEAAVPLLEHLDVSIVGFVPRLEDGAIDVKRLVLPLKNRAGDIAAWCLAIPFLRPGDLPPVDTSTCTTDPYLEGVALLYRQAYAHACSLRQGGQAIVALGHCHMTGGEPSLESERRIVIGGSQALSAGIFDGGIAYAALGHLHLAQRIGGHEHVRYCGSPLPMSFAETDYPHQIVRIDLRDEQAQAIQALKVPRAVELLRIPRQPAGLPEVLGLLESLQLEAQHDPQRHPYLEVRVRLDAPEPGLRARLESALDGKPVRLAKIEVSTTAQVQQTNLANSLDELEQLQPHEIFERLYHSKYQGDMTPRLRAAFAELLLAPADGKAAR